MQYNKYISRINRVVDYIENRLEHEFTLNELASISNFSKFHFVRIFGGVTGETPFQFILRLRLEKAASFLIRGREPISAIAYDCGFKSLPVFSKNFKLYFKESASAFRTKKSNLNKIIGNRSTYLYQPNDTPEISMKNEFVEVRELKEESVIYLRHIGSYRDNAALFGSLFNRLHLWANSLGIDKDKNLKSFIVYHDDLDIADEHKLRTSVCISAPQKVKVDGNLGKMTIQKGKYVVARFMVRADEIKKSWDWLMGFWFPMSGYQPDDKVCFEQYHDASVDGTFTIDICVPVKRLD